MGVWDSAFCATANNPTRTAESKTILDVFICNSPQIGEDHQRASGVTARFCFHVPLTTRRSIASEF